jgi:hypothetical protein
MEQTAQTLPVISAMTDDDLLNEYNTLTNKSLTKFATRLKGEKMLETARVKANEKAEKQAKKEADKQAKAELKLLAKVKEVRELTPEELKAQHDARSAAISNSWNNPEVAAKRAARNTVSVDGTIFGSVLKAFQALQLNVKKHIAFRAILKEDGKADFVQDGTTYHFELGDAPTSDAKQAKAERAQKREEAKATKKAEKEAKALAKAEQKAKLAEEKAQRKAEIAEKEAKLKAEKAEAEAKAKEAVPA